MDAVKYFKEKKRMLEALGGCKGENCNNCPFSSFKNGSDLACLDFQKCYLEEAVAIVEKWSQEHPQKTMLHDFLEKHPKANLNNDGIPKGVCPYSLGYEEEQAWCDGRCAKCWNRPLEE